MALSGSADAAGFIEETIDNAIEIGYGLAIGDVDGDGKLDILLADKTQFVWYRNPDWKKHVLAERLTLRDNVCIAAADIDGDGKVEIAVGGQWNPGETTDKTQSGAVFFLLRPEDPIGPWKPIPLAHDPTVHRMRWVRTVAGDWRLVVLPLHGIGNVKNEGPNRVAIRSHLPPAPERYGEPGAWIDTVIDHSLHAAHNFDDRDGDILVGGAEGILRKNVMNTDPDEDALVIAPRNSEPPTLGVGEVRFGREFVAAIEPMHGNQAVIYEPESGTANWRRTILTDALNQGHALAVGDVMGIGLDQVVVGWRNPDASGKVGIRMFYRHADTPSEWHSVVVGDNPMACEDLKLADLDGDGDLDIIASGRAPRNVVVYWNRR
ncbi:MAG: VCBS repeat-containing protein [Verrucomicrobiae bacterium]|nr:VCBS repeat-containing protein [Verrucomicrobiae bacterium]